MLPAYVGLVFFCVAGLHWLALRLEWRATSSQAAVAIAAVLVFLATGFHLQQKPRRGFIEAADIMLTAGLQENGTALVCSDPIGEGSFIAAVATTEPEPRTIVLRASKLLAQSSWVGEHYLARHHDPKSLVDAINRAHVEFIAMDDVDESPHHKMLVRGASAIRPTGC